MNVSKSSAIDIESADELEEYLRRTGRLDRFEQVSTQVLSGGVSNRTILVVKSNGERWVMKQALEKLRVAEDWYSSPLRIHREGLGMRWLFELAPSQAVPQLIFEDVQHHLLAMQAVPEPHCNWKSELLAGRIDLDLMQQFGALLGTLHRNAFLRRDELSELFADTQFFESLRIEPYYSFTANRVVKAQSFYERLISDTRSHRLSIVHGDYSPKNILVHQNRLFLIDHEVIHFGDPAFDIGFASTHLLSKYHHLVSHRARLADACHEFWRAYIEALGSMPWLPELQPRAVRQTLGCLLARVRGRSPLEYLNEVERNRQSVMVLDLMKNPPGNMDELMERWKKCCDRST